MKLGTGKRNAKRLIPLFHDHTIISRMEPRIQNVKKNGEEKNKCTFTTTLDWCDSRFLSHSPNIYRHVEKAVRIQRDML